MNAYTVSRLGECADEELFIALLTLAEPRRGILEKSPGMKRESLKRWFSGPGRTAGPFSRTNPTVRRQGRDQVGGVDGRWQSQGTVAQRAQHNHRRGGHRE